MNKYHINRDRFFEIRNTSHHKYLSTLLISMQIFLNKNYDGIQRLHFCYFVEIARSFC